MSCPGDDTLQGATPATIVRKIPSATSARAKRAEKVAAHLQQHPGQPLRYEQIATAVQLSNQQTSIALSDLLHGGALPGLRKVGRGTYQWDPPGPAQSHLEGPHVPGPGGERG